MALKEMKAAENYKNNLQNKYESMEQQMRESFQSVSEVGQKGRTLHFVNDSIQYIQMLKIHMKNLSIEIEHAEREFQQRYQTLMNIQMKLKKIELHKEVEHDKYKKEYKKKQQKLTDEINSTRQRGQYAKSL